MSLKNWQNFKWPYERLDVFTASEPFPGEQLKDTYVEGMGKPRKKNTKMMYDAMRKRWVERAP